MTALSELLLLPVERALNTGIATSVEAATAARALENKRMSLCVQPPDIRVCVSVHGGRLKLGGPNSTDADVQITGSPIELGRLFLLDPRAPIREGGVAFKGNTETAELFRELFNLATPEPEQQLARWFGASPAFQMTNTAQSFVHWLRSSANTSADDLGDILQYDSDLLVPRHEIEDHMRDVGDVSDAVARLEARAKRLRRHLDAMDLP